MRILPRKHLFQRGVGCEVIPEGVLTLRECENKQRAFHIHGETTQEPSQVGFCVCYTENKIVKRPHQHSSRTSYIHELLKKFIISQENKNEKWKNFDMGKKKLFQAYLYKIQVPCLFFLRERILLWNTR